MRQAEKSRAQFPLGYLDFSFTYSFPPHYDPSVDLSSTRMITSSISLGVKAAGA